MVTRTSIFLYNTDHRMLLFSKIKIHVLPRCMTACNLFVRASSIPTFSIKSGKTTFHPWFLGIVFDKFTSCKFKIFSLFCSVFLMLLVRSVPGEVRKCTQNVWERYGVSNWVYHSSGNPATSNSIGFLVLYITLQVLMKCTRMTICFWPAYDS